MANEYRRFRLNDLIIRDWSKFELKDNLKNCFQKIRFKNKINAK